MSSTAGEDSDDDGHDVNGHEKIPEYGYDWSSSDLRWDKGMKSQGSSKPSLTSIYLMITI